MQGSSPVYRGFLLKAYDASTQELVGSFANLPRNTQFFDGCSNRLSAVCHKGPSLFSTDLIFSYSYPRGTNVSFTAWVVVEVNTWAILHASTFGPTTPSDDNQCSVDMPSAAVLLTVFSPLLLVILAHLSLVHLLPSTYAQRIQARLYYSAPLAAAGRVATAGDKEKAPVRSARWWMQTVTCDVAASAARATAAEVLCAGLLLLSQAGALWLAQQPQGPGGARASMSKALGRLLQVRQLLQRRM